MSSAPHLRGTHDLSAASSPGVSGWPPACPWLPPWPSCHAGGWAPSRKRPCAACRREPADRIRPGECTGWIMHGLPVNQPAPLTPNIALSLSHTIPPHCPAALPRFPFPFPPSLSLTLRASCHSAGWRQKRHLAARQRRLSSCKRLGRPAARPPASGGGRLSASSGAGRRRPMTGGAS